MAAVTGDETDDLGRVIDATPFLGREAVVQGATPTAERDGWMIHLDVDEFGAIRHFPQGALMRTGWIEVVDEHGAVDQVPLDPTRHRPWRDDVMLELELEASRERTKAIAEMSLDTIRGLTGSGSIDYRVAESQGGRQSATFWAYFDDGALDAFERLIGLADSGWRHDQDDSIYVCSRWERAPGHPPFISPEVRSAELTYRRWLSPERGSQRD